MKALAVLLAVVALGAPPAPLDVRLRTDTPVSAAEQRAIVAKVRAAYAWVARTQAWPDARPLSAPLEVRLTARPDVLGTATDDVITIGLDYIRSDPALSQGTLAHELCHIQDRRQARPARVPGFIAEGRGLTNGFAYRRSLGLPPQPYDRGLARAITGFTPAEVAAVMADLAPGSLRDPEANLRFEFVGAWFVEYLRTTGYPDVQPRLARVITRLHAGQPFEAAFEAEFGVGFGKVAFAFVRHAETTRGSMRLKGTIWAGLGPV